MSLNSGRKAVLTVDNFQRINLWNSNDKKAHFHENKEENANKSLSKILDSVTKNTLNYFYPDSNNEFKKKIDALNLKFYLETEKFLLNKNNSEQCQISLFIILFKQINTYIKEIERLNLLIIQKKFEPKKIMERTDELIKKQNDFIVKEQLIETLKESKSHMEKKLLEAIINEDKLHKEIQFLKKENASYKNLISDNNIKILNYNNNTLRISEKLLDSQRFSKVVNHQTFHSSVSPNTEFVKNHSKKYYDNGTKTKKYNISLVIKDFNKSDEKKQDSFNTPFTFTHLNKKMDLHKKTNDTFNNNYDNSDLKDYSTYNTNIINVSKNSKFFNINSSEERKFQSENIINDSKVLKNGIIFEYMGEGNKNKDNKSLICTKKNEKFSTKKERVTIKKTKKK